MENAVSALTTSVTGATLWGSFQGIVPILAVVIPVSLGLFFARKLIRGAGNNGKTKI